MSHKIETQIEEGYKDSGPPTYYLKSRHGELVPLFPPGTREDIHRVFHKRKAKAIEGNATIT